MLETRWGLDNRCIHPGTAQPNVGHNIKAICVQVIQLVEGRASAYVFASPGCKKWDTCAPEAILTAVGGTTLIPSNMDLERFFSQFFCFYCPGKLTDMHGNTYCYHANVKHMNSAGVLATLRNHEYYLSRVPQSVLQALKLD